MGQVPPSKSRMRLIIFQKNLKNEMYSLKTTGRWADLVSALPAIH